jgi:hypothetical protein
MLFKDFFWKYLRVKLSMGKLILVKIRTPLRDYYKVGYVSENNVIYKTKDTDGRKEDIRITIPKDSLVFYKSIGVTWVDVDEEKNAILTVKYNPVSGFDAIKWNNLYIRALTRPSIGDQKEKIIILLLVLVIVAILGIGYFSYINYKELLAIKNALPQILNLIQHSATISPTNVI